jgi:hypothetical protein
VLKPILLVVPKQKKPVPTQGYPGLLAFGRWFCTDTVMIVAESSHRDNHAERMGRIWALKPN